MLFSGLVQLANSIVDQLHISNRISSLGDLTSVEFAMIYEGLCGERIPGKKTKWCSSTVNTISPDQFKLSIADSQNNEVLFSNRVIFYFD